MSCFWGRIGTNHSKIKRWAVSGGKEGQTKMMSRIWGRMFPRPYYNSLDRLASLMQRMIGFTLEFFSAHFEAPLASNSTTKGVFSRNFSLAQYKEIPFFCHHKSAKSGSWSVQNHTSQLCCTVFQGKQDWKVFQSLRLRKIWQNWRLISLPTIWKQCVTWGI